jgi:HEAT repeat protein
MKKEKDIEKRAMIAHAFREIGEPAFLPLLDVMEEEDEDLRKVALIGLGDMGKTAIPLLVQMLDKEDDEAFRFHIVKALLATDHPAATEHLFRRGLL